MKVGEVDASFKEEVFIRLLRQHVGRLCDGAQLSQTGGNLQLGLFPELLLLFLDLLQPGSEYQHDVKTVNFTLNNMVHNCHFHL